MNWIWDLFTAPSTPHDILILALVISVGLALGRIRVAGLSLGSAWILFVGLAFAHFGLVVDEHMLHFVREFGLVLFVFSIGMQVGPSFLTSLRKGGLRLNLVAASVVLLSVLTTVILFFATGLPGPTMVGIMSGAVTNTPGLGAAEQTLMDTFGRSDGTLTAGYAMAYPLAVVGIIVSMLILKKLFRIDTAKEAEDLAKKDGGTAKLAGRLALKITNPALVGRTVQELYDISHVEFVVPRLRRATTGEVELVKPETKFEQDDLLLAVCRRVDRDALSTIVGASVEVPEEQWHEGSVDYGHASLVVSREKLNGISIGKLALRSRYGVNVTRVRRGGNDLVATADLRLVLGDRITVVGSDENLAKAERLLGNSPRILERPHLGVLFLGIVAGVVLGSIPFDVPGVPQPVKLGLAGGPLIVALLLGRYGPSLRLITWSTVSANLLLREIGIAMFLAGVGLKSGGTFVQTIVEGGYMWVGWGIIITMVPLLIVGFVARKFLGMNFLTLAGVLAGSTTDPPALGYAQSLSESHGANVGYAAVYPLTMFLRVIAAQVLIILLT
ncbi:MAG: transporter [Propionibacterium sp.]|nr:MAG: transporter [Propionibacterium sp.]